MQIIPECERPGIVLDVVNCPDQLDLADVPSVEVRIENRSTLTLASTEPNPLNISYFWIQPDGSRIEGLRTQLTSPIQPNSAANVRLTVKSPSVTGNLVLRVALVQEHVFWFSDPPVGHFVDRNVEVRRERWWNSPDEAPIFGDIDQLNHRKFASLLSFEGGNRPLLVAIETVNACNFDCIFCPYSSAKRKKGVMPLDLFEMALDQYAAIGGGSLSLTPKLGDVFLDRFLIERFHLIRQRAAITDVSFTTNASLFQMLDDDEFAFIMSQLRGLHISLYGLDSEEHNLITRRNMFDRVIDNVRRAVDAAGDTGKIRLGLRLLRERSPEFLKEWVEKTFGRRIPFTWTVEYTNWLNAVDTSKPLPLDGRWIQLTGSRDQCFLPMLSSYILVNGDVTFCPCVDYGEASDLHLGNITENPLAEIYKSEKVRHLWKKLPSVCESCTFYQPLTNIALPMYAGVFDDPRTIFGG
jgi:radical SAM protein with 4Fe4S-binding SPASM domain